MKRGLFLFFVLIVFSLQDFSLNAQTPPTSPQNSSPAFNFDPQRHLLKIEDSPVPPWLVKVISLSDPKSQYSFVETFSLPYPVEGWYPITNTKDYTRKNIPSSREDYIPTNDLSIANVFDNPTPYTPSNNIIKGGWFFSRSNVTNSTLPKSGWYFSPTYHLFFNKEGMEKLTRFFSTHLGDVLPLQIGAPNKVQQYQFVRVIIKPNTDILKVELKLPLNWNLCYQTVQKMGDGQRVYVLTPYMPPQTKWEDPQSLYFNVTFKDGTTKAFYYQVFFDLKDGLGFFEPKI